jgi:hypothetical protein
MFPKRGRMCSRNAHGFEEYATNFLADYDRIVESIVVELVNTQDRSDRQIAGAIGAPRVVVAHVLDVLASQLVEVSKTTGPNSLFGRVSPQLARRLGVS